MQSRKDSGVRRFLRGLLDMAMRVRCGGRQDAWEEMEMLRVVGEYVVVQLSVDGGRIVELEAAAGAVG